MPEKAPPRERRNAPPSFERLNLQKQWEDQVRMWSDEGVLETFPGSKILGVRGIDKKEYPVPTPEDIQKRLEAKRESVEHALSTFENPTMLLVPRAMSLDSLIEAQKQAILRHAKEGKLFATRERPEDPAELLAVDLDQPLWAWEGYGNADISGKLVYHPSSFDTKRHGGKTKTELLKESGEGWDIWIVEGTPNLPREGKGATVGGRKQLEANKTPEEYKKLMQTNPMYKGESGITPEVEIAYFLTHLKKTNEVVNDYQGKGSLSYQTDAFFPESGNVPYAYWYRGYRQARLRRDDPRYRYGGNAARVGVRV